MAKLCSCYTLCPLIEKGLIGLSEDSSPGCVIVTLGKNMVIRYKLSDQNQVSSWSSRDRLTGPVVYDPSRKSYVAVFNQSTLREWAETESNLNDVKKIKFAQPIHVILPGSSSGESVVVFKNGAVCLLSSAISGRTSSFKGTLTGNFQIENCWLLTIESVECIAIVASGNQEKKFLQLMDLETKKVLWRINIHRSDGVKLLSKCIVKRDNSAILLTLWSDSQLWSLPLRIEAPENKGIGTPLYVITTVSTNHPVAMIQLSTNHIAVYGEEPNEEGAALAVLNLKFLLIQARQHFKLFPGGIPQLWVQSDKLLLVVGSILTVVPFTLETEQLLALVGSLKTQPANPNPEEREFVAVPQTMVWKKSSKSSISDNSGMPENIKAVAELGLSQALLCEATLPTILDSRNMDDLLWVIRNFSDFPEMELVRLLVFCLEEPDETFESLKNAEIATNLEKIDYDALSANHETSTASVAAEWSPGRWKFLHTLLSVRFTDAVAVPYLRGGLSLEQCQELIDRILRLTAASQNMDEIRPLLQWTAVLLDSHHQQFVLAGKTTVGSTLTLLRGFLQDKMEYLRDLRSLHPLLDQLVNKRLRKSVKPLANTFYSVEPLSLY